MIKAIKQLRKAAHLTPKQCQEFTGINFSEVERGARELGSQSICKLSKFFRIYPEQFMLLAEKNLNRDVDFFDDDLCKNNNVAKYYSAIQKLIPKS